MKVNDVLRKGEVALRVLSMKDDLCFCINCNTNFMPVWMPMSTLDEYTPDTAPMVDKNITAKQKQVAHERYTMIAPMLAFLTDDKERNRLMNRVAAEQDISKQTLRKYICRYLVYQDIAALAPAVRETKQELTQDQKHMRWALNKYFYTPKKTSLADVYVKLLKEKYCDEEGNLPGKYPSIRQFRYFEQKYRKQENYLISRNGLKSYQRNDRPLLGEGVQEYAPYIGVGMLDATICDIYLVNKEGLIVGRPILVAGVDANTSLCMGYSLLWEGGVYSLQQLMLNIVSNKVDLCRKIGIAVEERQWPVSSLPGVMVTDMGSEYIGETFEQITELGVTLISLPAFRPDLKGPIEKLFDLVQEKYKDALKGKGVIMPDFQERGAHDYRKDACLTLEEFERIVVRCIVYYNSERVISDYPYTTEMIQEQVRPYACDIWAYKVQEPGTNLIEASEKEIVLSLLPRTEGKFTRYGLMVNKLRYHREGYKEAYLRGGTCVVTYNPDDVTAVWMKTDDTGYEEFRIIESAFAGQTLDQVTETKKGQDTLVRNEAEEALRAKVRLMAFIETAAQQAIPPAKPDIKGIRDNRTTEKRRNHKNIGEVIDNG